jgi:polysaccharide export outer membrane protein
LVFLLYEWVETMSQIIGAILCIFTVLFVEGVAAENLQLGAGDIVKIAVYGNPDLGLETRVSEAGKISFPLIGEVSVAGMSTYNAEQKISNMLESGGFLRKAQVNVIVSLMQSQQVSVLGQVNRPGRYPIEGKRKLIDLLAAAGGVNADGADSVSLIRSRNGVSAKQLIDVNAMMLNGDMRDNVDLLNNDVIYVERAPRFYIYGEVQRPGTFRLERNMTVLQALAIGGGVSARGTERNIKIKRRDALGLLQVLLAKNDDVLQIDDVLYVQEGLF